MYYDNIGPCKQKKLFCIPARPSEAPALFYFLFFINLLNHYRRNYLKNGTAIDGLLVNSLSADCGVIPNSPNRKFFPLYHTMDGANNSREFLSLHCWPHSQSCGMGKNASGKLFTSDAITIIGHGIAASWSTPHYTFLSVVVVWMPACICRRS